MFAGQQYVVGQCNVCGKPTRFFYQEEALWRESLNCVNCRTTSRYRSITRGILRAIAELTGEELQTLATLSRSGTQKNFVSMILKLHFITILVLILSLIS